MKRIIATICVCFLFVHSNAQTPNSFRYQAAIQTLEGTPMANKTVALRISVLRSDVNRERVYAEFQSLSTDEFGMINLQIGQGNVISGNFSQITWGSDAHFLRIELDENGGSEFKLLSEVQLLSVPYALHAKSADNVDDADADATNEIQQLTIEGNILTISNGNSITLPEEEDGDSTNEIQELSINGQLLSISNGNSITLPEEQDGDSENELQQLSIEGNVLTISNGNSVNLPASNSVVPPTDGPIPVAFRGAQIFAHPTDNSVSINFGAFAGTGATSDSDGQSNTSSIVAALGDGNYAAKLCDDLSAFGFEDWYLPSRAELDALYKQNYLLADYGLDGYWSSTETANNKAWAINFLDGGLTDPTKNQSRRCLCVRKD
ncbi:Lcl domain-containing protein [Fulvivirga lutea]|uniref:DUF1566 domain-containing protein n=1 Tax=Fulvivirga lutea TaxID=2810512 RepID=A0A974WJQ4_9BACT|nr:DUF1566 domain-containing protein [Fulvivirga lutea]QSE98467.1 DUF1566 domain-containing protein [Fulvivirga lutea]